MGSETLSAGEVSIPVTADTSKFGGVAKEGLEAEGGLFSSLGAGLGKKLMSGFIAVLGVEAIVAEITKSTTAASAAQQSQLGLSNAIASFPSLAGLSVSALNKLNDSLQKKTQFDRIANASGEAVLAQFKLTGSQLVTLTPLLDDYAAKTGETLPAAAKGLGEALLGQSRALKAVGIDFVNTKTLGGNYNELVGDLRTQVGGFATKEGASMSGRLDIMKNSVNDLQVKIGTLLMPVVSNLVTFTNKNIIPALSSSINWFEKYKNILGPTVGAITALTVAAWAMNVALDANPIGLVVLAIAGAVAEFGVFLTQGQAVRNFMIDAMADMQQFALGVGTAINGIIQNMINGFVGGINILMAPLNAILKALNLPALTLPTVDLTSWSAAASAHIDKIAQGQHDLNNGVALPTRVGVASSNAAGLSYGDGGTVQPVPGGKIIRVAERGQAETILNTKDLNNFAAMVSRGFSGAGVTQYISTSDPMLAANQASNMLAARLSIAR
jgi:hypothetical protein